MYVTVLKSFEGSNGLCPEAKIIPLGDSLESHHAD